MGWIIDRIVQVSMGVFLLMGVSFLVLSIIRGFDADLLIMGVGSFAWIGLIALAMQPWRD